MNAKKKGGDSYMKGCKNVSFTNDYFSVSGLTAALA